LLKNKRVIVTGAGAGIGKEIVRLCLEEGDSIIACDVNEEALVELERSMKNTNLSTYTVDVSSYKEVVRFFEWIDEKGEEVHALVNNAGIYLAQNILDYTEESIDSVLNINVKGAVYFSQLFAKKLMGDNEKGTIVNMSSVSGMEGSSDAIYGLSKSAILGLTKSCAINFSPHIRVNAVAPTMVDTTMMKSIPEWRKQEYWNSQLIQTPVTARDVAETVLFLLSDKSKHYTGATFDLNNGGYLR
jgi:3-oxoacyl-[acyl-carrier protein] reductase